MIVLVHVNTRGKLNTTSFDAINEIPTLAHTLMHRSIAVIASDSQAKCGTK